MLILDLVPRKKGFSGLSPLVTHNLLLFFMYYRSPGSGSILICMDPDPDPYNPNTSEDVERTEINDCNIQI